MAEIVEEAEISAALSIPIELVKAVLDGSIDEEKLKEFNPSKPVVNAELYSHLNIIKIHDFNTYSHCYRVAQMSLYISKCLGLTSEEINNLWYAAILHDMGKIKVPVKILSKKDSLDDNDWNIIKQHPENGYKLIKRERIATKDILEGIISHHERWNGNGYPNGLKGEEIPLCGRIITVADTLDAMVNSRPYRYFPLSVDEALTEVNIHAGIQFDPYIVKNLLSQDREILYAALLGFRNRCLG